MNNSLDIIGDVHGQCDKLLALLAHLGYSLSGGAYRHPSRTAVFVGDLIDRGPKQVQTVELVRAMVDAGSARCILGNHEFNAIAWATPDPMVSGEFLRAHGKPGNLAQHRAFLEQVGEWSSQHWEFIAWFGTLPLWLELPGLRIVHACWHEESMARLRAVLGPGDTLTEDLVLRASQRETWEFAAVETICKGPEVPLPPGISFADKEGKARHEVRVRWWQEDLSTYRKAAIGPPGDLDMLPDLPMPPGWTTHRYAGPPVVFGHYWFTGTPEVISTRFACVDYSAAREECPLVAYRWDGEGELDSGKLMRVVRQR
jgi:hypothetical protein